MPSREPHKRPVCGGTGQVVTRTETTAGDVTSPCPACQGVGVLWEPDNSVIMTYERADG